jgi:pyridoxamine 5'-phosphate oxidase
MVAEGNRLESLQAVESAVWAELQAAPRDKGHPWRVGVLATVDGEAADARSVVLRDLDLPRRTLLIYADSRSPKAAQMAAHPMGTLVLWSPSLSWQLRLRVSLSLQTTGLMVSSRWAQLKMTPGAQDYLSPLPPGTRLDRPHPERGSREHFGVVSAAITAIDWLELHAQGHRRARFDAQGAHWLTP